MKCSHSKCSNPATVLVGFVDDAPDRNVPLCDECLDALRLYDRNAGHNPDDETTGIRVIPCPTL